MLGLSHARVSNLARRLAAGLAAAAGCVAAAGCETTGGGLTSQYFGGGESGRLYQYGNFCGGGWPEYPAENTPAENVAFIATIEPVDDLDRACRAHDRCYWQFGADNPECDAMFGEMLRDPLGGAAGELLFASPGAFLDNEFSGQCANLAAEMLIAVAQFKQEDFVSRLTNDDQFATTMGLLVGFNALRNVSAGFPETPGLCFFKPEQVTSVEPAASTALQSAARSAGMGLAISLQDYEQFPPADQSSLAAGLAALSILRAAAEASE
ncbi:MAG: hypothetical protein PVI23_10830 [Maricaulaceae bacterium]|jgi:hypothetical protein